MHLHISRKIHIRIVTNYNVFQISSKHDMVNDLIKAGLDVRIIGTVMHAKYAIIDSRILIHGSANWSYSGFSRNIEATIISDQQLFIREFEKNFNELWLESF